MIHRWLKKFGKKPPEQETATEPLDLENVYVKLRLSLARIQESGLKLSARPGGLGRFNSFTPTLAAFNASLVEVNGFLKRKEHIETGRYYTRHLTLVRFDDFLFVENGFYVEDVSVRLNIALEQIELYVGYMKDADKALYGVMEHNHRQLLGYTQMLGEFLDTLFTHFGSD